MPVIHPDDRQQVAASKKLLQSKKSSQVLVYRIITDDNSVRWIEDRRTSIFTGDDHYIGIDGIMLDVTDRVKSEEEKKLLEHGIRSKQRLETIGTLAGGIAHDFNNILVPILGYAELAVSTLPHETPLYEYSVEIMKAAERAKNLVSQILIFSRPEESNLVPVPVQSLLNEAPKLLRPSIPATINIKPIIDDSCRNVLADSSQIHQIIVNLCTNAFYAMKDTDGTLTIELHEVHDKSMYHVLCNSDAEYLMLSVSDTGTGMDEATMERIYEPFFTTKPVNDGTGLGLSVVHGIVKSCKGEITVESKKGKGSTFRVFLPVVEAKAEGIKILSNPVKGKGRVLFVDDEPATVKFIFTMLSKLGYNTETTNSPVEALKLFKRNPAHFDLIITDLTMPGMTGIELARKIHEKNPDLPIILMTGYGKDIDYATPPENYGIRRILKKPVKINMLASTIDEIINIREKKV
jgi:signal transduction histidine kinase/CheY-like chemotaxis protein